jgi:hypothetical protein
VDVAEIMQATKAREQAIPDWEEVKGWAAGIADAQRPDS